MKNLRGDYHDEIQMISLTRKNGFQFVTFTTQQLYNSNSSVRIWTQCMNDDEKQPSLVCENLYLHHNYLPVTAVAYKRV